MAIIPNFGLSTVTGTILFMPWFAQLVGGKILGNALTHLSTPASLTSQWIQQYNSIGDLTQYLPVTIWILFMLSILWVVGRRDRYAFPLIIWWSIILIMANPQIFGLPGQGILSNFAVFIAMYIPASLIIGGAIGWIGSLEPFLERIWPILFLLVVTMGGVQRLNDLEPQKHSLVTRPDIRAMGWIEENTPLNATFMPNAFFTNGNALLAGSDGGWWLTTLAKRQSTLPPLNYGNEKGPIPEYRLWINELYQNFSPNIVDEARFHDLLIERGVTHLYVGQLQGRVNYSGEFSFDPQRLDQSDFFKTIYHADRVWIFKVVP